MPRKPPLLEGSFAVLHSRCAALDVHKDSITVCLLTPGEVDEPHSEVRQFGTRTRELEALARWLLESGITHAAMESTGFTGSRSSISWSRCANSRSSTPAT
ncbi:MAG: hypothetical protein IPM24_03515 [Bryobacterales bacterium]|nr:hypothetical protein [Bryobacterales bacterium]